MISKTSHDTVDLNVGVGGEVPQRAAKGHGILMSWPFFADEC